MSIKAWPCPCKSCLCKSSPCPRGLDPCPCPCTSSPCPGPWRLDPCPCGSHGLTLPQLLETLVFLKCNSDVWFLFGYWTGNDTVPRLDYKICVMHGCWFSYTATVWVQFSLMIMLSVLVDRRSSPPCKSSPCPYISMFSKAWSLWCNRDHFARLRPRP